MTNQRDLLSPAFRKANLGVVWDRDYLTHEALQRIFAMTSPVAVVDMLNVEHDRQMLMTTGCIDNDW